MGGQVGWVVLTRLTFWSTDKSHSNLAIERVFRDGWMAFDGVFTPVLAKHSKSFSLVDAISVGVDRMQRNFEPIESKWERGAKPNSAMGGACFSGLKV